MLPQNNTEYHPNFRLEGGSHYKDKGKIRVATGGKSVVFWWLSERESTNQKIINQK